MQLRRKLRRGITYAVTALSLLANTIPAYTEEPDSETLEEVVTSTWQIHSNLRVVDPNGTSDFDPESGDTSRRKLLLGTSFEYPVTVNSNWSSNTIVHLRNTMELEGLDIRDIHNHTPNTGREFWIDEMVFKYTPKDGMVKGIRGGIFQPDLISNQRSWDRAPIIQRALADSLPTSDMGFEVTLDLKGISVIASAMVSPRQGGFSDQQGDSHLEKNVKLEKRIGNFRIFAGRQFSRINYTVNVAGVELNTDRTRMYVTYLNTLGTNQMDAYAEFKLPVSFSRYRETIIYGSREWILGSNRLNLGVRGNLNNGWWYKLQGIERENHWLGAIELGVDFQNYLDQKSTSNWIIHSNFRIINWTSPPYFNAETIETGRNELVLPSYGSSLEYPINFSSQWSSNIIFNLRNAMEFKDIDLTDEKKKTLVSDKRISVDEMVLEYSPENIIVSSIRGGILPQDFISIKRPWERTQIIQRALSDHLLSSYPGLEVTLGTKELKFVGTGTYSSGNGQDKSYLGFNSRAEGTIGNYTMFLGRQANRGRSDVNIIGIERSTDNSLAYATLLDTEGPREMDAYLEYRLPFTRWNFQEAIIYGSHELITEEDRTSIGVRLNMGNHWWTKIQGVKENEKLWLALELGIDFWD